MIRLRPFTSCFRVAAVGALLPCLASHVHAQSRRTTTTTTRTTTRSLESTSETEVTRRQSLAASAEENIKQGDASMIREDYESAVKFYRTATDSLPDAPATGDRRAQAMKKFFAASLKLADQRIVEGRYLDAETVTKVILRPEYDPNYKPAIEKLRHLEDPEYYNQTVTPKSIQRVQEVRRLLIEGQQYYDTARYDKAFDRYDRVLAIDPYNDAARRGQERVNLARTRHSDPAGYDETRSRMIWQVSRGWESPVRRNLADVDPRKGVQKISGEQGTVAINRKLQSILIPNIEFRNTTLNDAVEYLRQEAKRLDTDPDEGNRGVNIFLKLPAGSSAPRAVAPVTPEAGIPGLPPGAETVAPGTAPVVTGTLPTGNTRISLSLSRIPLLAALNYVAQQAGLKVKVEQYAVSIVPLSEEVGGMVTLEIRVPPNFIGTTTSGGTGGALQGGATSATGGAGASPGTDASGVGGVSISRQDAKTFLESSGVTFPPGASAVYLPATSKLVVRNTQDNIDLVQSLVTENTHVITQVEIESKFIEVTQDNLKELGFDWTLGQFNIGSSEKVFAGGGTSDGGRSFGSTGNSFPFQNGSGAIVGNNPITAGNRSGSFGISANAIDALLLGTGAAAAAPGIFSVAGVFTDPQFQVVIRALNQQKGVDLLSAPRVTTKSGQKATIEIIRELIYPTQFQPPQIPQNFGNTGSNNAVAVGQSSGSGAFPVTPTTPTAFDKRNTGVTLEVEPVIGPDNYTIDLNLQPQVVDFDGFINYGSPIQTVSTNAIGMAQVNVLTQNTINQPIFSTRKVSTSVSVYDGSTVVLGGLVREDIQKVNDKVPILGDVPLVGRLFRSKIDQNIKRNLIIFVTARLIDPAGQPLLNTEEEEEVVQPLNGPDNYVQPPGPLPNYYKK